MAIMIVCLGYLLLVALHIVAKKYNFVMIESLIKAFCIGCFCYGYYKIVCLVVDR